MPALKGIISSKSCVFIVVPCFKWKVPRNPSALEILSGLLHTVGKVDKMGIDEMGK